MKRKLTTIIVSCSANKRDVWCHLIETRSQSSALNSQLVTKCAPTYRNVHLRRAACLTVYGNHTLSNHQCYPQCTSNCRNVHRYSITSLLVYEHFKRQRTDLSIRLPQCATNGIDCAPSTVSFQNFDFPSFQVYFITLSTQYDMR